MGITYTGSENVASDLASAVAGSAAGLGGSVLGISLLETDIYQVSQTSVFFTADGTRMLYTEIDGTDTVQEWDLSTPYDLSTATFATTLTHAAGQPYGVTVSADGTTMTVHDATNSRLGEWNMSTPWDVSTAVEDTLSRVTSPNAGVAPFKSSKDGAYIYGVSSVGAIVRYGMTTPWDLSDAAADGNAANLETLSGLDLGTYGDIDISADGTELWVIMTDTGFVHYFSFGTAWDLTTLTYGGGLEHGGSTAMYSVHVDKAQGLLFLEARTNHTVYKFAYTTP